jgi:hypothetical protein
MVAIVAKLFKSGVEELERAMKLRSAMELYLQLSASAYLKAS